MNAIVEYRIPSPVRNAWLTACDRLASFRAVVRLQLHRWAIRVLDFQPDDVSSPRDIHAVCRLDEVPDGGVVGVDLPEPLGLPLVVRREGDSVHAWLNICPQDGRRMNWAPGLFHVENGSLRCAIRGAVFALDRGGVCVSGPCRGQTLVPVAVRVEHGLVMVK